jgi:ribosomal protein S18 acetylase RimI-like enzyme
MLDPDVRTASGADAAALAQLEAEARLSLLDARGGVRWLEEHAEIGTAWPASIARRTVLVGVIDQHVVGYLVLDVDGRIAHIDQVYVTPEARELGFGDALLAAATDRARVAGAGVLEGHALPGDRNTKNLYERAGITARLITVSRRLD